MANARIGTLYVTLAAAAALLAGCAAQGGKSGPSAGGARPVQVDEGGDLSDLGKAVKTPEDRLVLDLMLGYRMLLLRNPDAQSLDKQTLKRSRDAYDRLETILRHGGVKAQDTGERVFTVNDGDRLSLQEVIRSAAQSASKAAREGDWDRARERWKEIVQSRPAIAFTVEEAQWGLVLGDALRSSAMPDSIKRRLRDVNETYLADSGYEGVGAQVKALLEMVSDVKLQRELKKLANRAWERDKRAGRIQPEPKPAPAETAAGAAPASPDTASPAPSADTAAAASPGTEPAPMALDTAAAAQADSLAAKGKYVAALKSLAGGNPDAPWVKERKAKFGDRFCEEKRRAAANAFKDYKRTSNAEAKKSFLRKTADELDSCLFYFPDIPVSGKVRKNRDMVEGEMGRLK